MDVTHSNQIREYIAGAFIAFSLVLLASESLVYYFNSSGAQVGSINRDLPGLSVCLHLAGGTLGGYLVGRRRERDTIRAGAITALFAYLAEFIYMLLFVGSFDNSMHAVLGFFFGGVLGAMYANYRGARSEFTSNF